MNGRCVVCGKEQDTPDDQACAKARNVHGEPQPAESVDGLLIVRFPDGVIAGACDVHTADEVRTAWVLTRWKLSTTDGGEVPV